MVLRQKFLNFLTHHDRPLNVFFEFANSIRISALCLLAELATTFESLLVLLPASQAQLLESLALDPTDKPQSREYITKHSLSRGGTLQGALLGLQHKGSIYGTEFGYRLALALFALWLRQEIGSRED
jgi:hypothetical protein